MKKCPDINSPEYDKIMDEFVKSLTMIEYNPNDLYEVDAWIKRNKMKGAHIVELFNKVSFCNEIDAVAFKLWYKPLNYSF